MNKKGPTDSNDSFLKGLFLGLSLWDPSLSREPKDLPKQRFLMKTRAAPGPQGRPCPGSHSPREQNPLTPSASRLGHGLVHGQRDVVDEACGFRDCGEPG